YPMEVTWNTIIYYDVLIARLIRLNNLNCCTLVGKAINGNNKPMKIDRNGILRTRIMNDNVFS
uniref:Recep_L_domain domain-containing protein n=1 Tax=Loa loa TaxID=7209 RepID=A0A1I7VD74_LOALO